MIRIAPFRVPSPCITQGTKTIFFPDGLDYPSFRGRKSGQAHYTVCWKAAAEQLAERGASLSPVALDRLTDRRHDSDSCKRYARNATISPSITLQIGHLLRLRVLQEFEILAEEIQRRPRGAEDSPILRRLTRAEFKSIKETGVIPCPRAAAVLVVPPLNKSVLTKKRPEPASLLDNAPPKDADLKPSMPRVMPLSELLPTSQSNNESDSGDDLAMLHKQGMVPLYNGVALFPVRSQRAALYALLCRLLDIERRARWRQHGRPPQGQSDSGPEQDKWARGDEKGSHAFLLCSDASTVLRGDAVGAAIALMRVRMWEGAGWVEGTYQKGGWLWGAYRRRGDGTISI
jgi:hypothetical protein